MWKNIAIISLAITLVVVTGINLYFNMQSNTYNPRTYPYPYPYPPYPYPRPTPTPTPTPTPSPTPTITPKFGEVTVDMIKFEYNGYIESFMTVPDGSKVTAMVYLEYTGTGSPSCKNPIYAPIKIEWVKDVQYGFDTVVNTTKEKVVLCSSKKVIYIPNLTDKEGKGGYFIRVYENINGQWVRIDHWTSWLWNPGRPEVTFN